MQQVLWGLRPSAKGDKNVPPPPPPLTSPLPPSWSPMGGVNRPQSVSSCIKLLAEQGFWEEGEGCWQVLVSQEV